MGERRHLGEQRRLDVLTGDEHVGRLEAGAEAGLDKILTLDREQPELVAPTPFVQLAEELEPLVVARRDQEARAALALSAIAPNAAGSLTARSASTFRSSSIPAFVAPVHELVVREAVRARRGVDARDPELAELALAHLPVAVRVGERVLDLLLRVAVVRRFAAPVALGLLEYLAALLLRVD